MITKLFNAVTDGILKQVTICEMPKSEDRAHRIGQPKQRDVLNIRLILFVKREQIGWTFHPDDKQHPNWDKILGVRLQDMLYQLYCVNNDERLLELAHDL